MRRLVIALAAAGLIHIAPAAAAVGIFYQSTVDPVDGRASFNGGFNQSTAYPNSILAKTYRVTVDTGSINELSWVFDPEEQRLWWERIGPDEPFMMNGNEYNFAEYCNVEPGGTCDTVPGGVMLTGNVGHVRQAFTPGYNDCAAALTELITANFIGISGDCAVTFVAQHSFFIDVASTAPVTLTIASIPEPGSWALLMTGFGLVGGALRRVRPALRPAP